MNACREVGQPHGWIDREAGAEMLEQQRSLVQVQVAKDDRTAEPTGMAQGGLDRTWRHVRRKDEERRVIASRPIESHEQVLHQALRELVLEVAGVQEIIGLVNETMAGRRPASSARMERSSSRPGSP